MQSIKKQLNELGPDLCLSVERWLAVEHAQTLEDGIEYSTLVDHVNNQTSTYTEKCLVLDTKSAREGLLVIPIVDVDKSMRRSSKKIAEAGDLIISRLRPYLLQVAYIPPNLEELTGHKQVFISTEFFVFRGKSKKSIAYLLPWLLGDNVQKVIQGASTGGHHPRFDLDLLTSLHVPEGLYKQRNILSKKVEDICVNNLSYQKQLSTLLGYFM